MTPESVLAVRSVGATISASLGRATGFGAAVERYEAAAALALTDHDLGSLDRPVRYRDVWILVHREMFIGLVRLMLSLIEHLDGIASPPWLGRLKAGW